MLTALRVGIWDVMTNQQVVDYVRAELAERTPLDEVCELVMDNCLAPDSEVGGLGCDNMSIIIVGILHGKTLEEWYDWIAKRVENEAPKKDALGNDVKAAETQKNDTESSNDEETSEGEDTRIAEKLSPKEQEELVSEAKAASPAPEEHQRTSTP